MPAFLGLGVAALESEWEARRPRVVARRVTPPADGIKQARHMPTTADPRGSAVV